MSILMMSDTIFGVWVATAVHDTSQVVATSFSYSDAAGELATIIKLTRNIFIIPVIIILAIKGSAANLEASLPEKKVEENINKVNLVKTFPWFIIGFCVMSLLNSVGLFSIQTIALISSGSRFLILVALAGVGLGTNFKKMGEIGFRPIVLGLIAAVTVGVIGLLLVTRIYI